MSGVSMAEVRITRRWSDEETLYVTVIADSSYPDALDQARATAIRTYAEACDVTITSFGVKGDDEATP
jgi:hypothetical protein